MRSKYFLSAFFFLTMMSLTVSSCYSSKEASTTTKSSSPERRANTVKREGATDHANFTLADMLRRVPGVVVSGNNTVLVRGPKSLTADNEPLFVVDGVPVGMGYSNVSSINPQDVDKITVLTGPQASLYGARGANGVIVIKTKN